MGKFVTRLIVVCNGQISQWENSLHAICQLAKSSQPPILEPVYLQGTQRSSHVGVLKGNPRRVTCTAFICLCGVGKVHRPTIADNGDPVAVSLCGLQRPATSNAYSKEIPGKFHP